MYYDERENLVNYNVKDEENNYNEYNLTNKNEKKWDNDFNTYVENININNFRHTKRSLFSTTEGFNKGNMVKEEYVPYKNYIYKVIVKGERDELLLKIQELTFKVIDLNIYLDIHPNDNELYNEFKNTVKELKTYKDTYEKNYGPLCMTDTLYYDSYKWTKNPWPWMNEGGNN